MLFRIETRGGEGKRWGSAGKRWGTLERVPQTPQNFSEQIMIDGIRRSCPVPAFSCAPAWRLECRVLQNRLSRFCRVWRTRIDLPVPPGASPRRTPHPTHFQCRIPPSPRGCKGRSPLHKKTKNLPLPRRGRRVRGMGAEKQAKGRIGRRPRGHAPPTGYRGGRANRRPRGQAPISLTPVRFRQLRPTAGHSPTPRSPHTPPADDPLSASFRCRARRHAENRWRHRR